MVDRWIVCLIVCLSLHTTSQTSYDSRRTHLAFINVVDTHTPYLSHSYSPPLHPPYSPFISLALLASSFPLISCLAYPLPLVLHYFPLYCSADVVRKSKMSSMLAKSYSTLSQAATVADPGIIMYPIQHTPLTHDIFYSPYPS